MERAVVEYAVNALWQLPLLAVGAWLLLRMVKPGPAAQHRVWLGVLGLAFVLPLYGMHGGARADSAPARSIVEPAATSSDMSPATAFDGVGEPGGLILGQRSTAHGQATSWLALAGSVRQIQLNATAARSIAGLYLVMMIAGIVRLARAWRVARRMVKESREFALTDAESATLEDCARRFGVKAPGVRVSDEISGPVVIGAAKPVLLWPEGIGPAQGRDGAAAYSSEELTAVLCHELAHIRRRDYLMNLACEAAALPLKWHPVTYGVERRIRSTREMACDAMAAEVMESDVKYAECLLSLAQNMVAGRGMAAAVGLFNGNALEERVMQLTEAKTAMSTRAKAMRGAAGLAAMTGTVLLAGMFHVVPAMAQTATTTQPVPAQGAPTGSQVKSGIPGGVPGGVQGGVQGGIEEGIVTPPVAEPAQPAPAAAAEPVAVEPAGIAEPAPAAAPQSAPVVPQATPEPAPDATPAPSAAPAPTPNQEPAPKTDAKHDQSNADGRQAIWIDGETRRLTPEERAHIEAQLEEAQKRIAEQTARLTSGEIQKQIDEAQRRAQEEVNSADLQQRMADAQKRIAEAEARLNSPEFRKQIEDAQKQACDAAQRINSAEIQRQLAEAQRQIAAQTARLNSPEFRKQLEEAGQAAAKVNSAEIQKQMAEAQKRIADALAKMKAEDETQPTK